MSKKVFAKCHGPISPYFTDAKAYPVTKEEDGWFTITHDAGRGINCLWVDSGLADRWERIERDDTPESVLKECRHVTEAVYSYDGSEFVITVDDRDVVCRKRFNSDGQTIDIPLVVLRAINEAVARHDAANGGE